MPLLKKKTHQLVEHLPEGLKAEEQVFVIRFTSEVFRDYE
jgi:hypothetical protein